MGTFAFSSFTLDGVDAQKFLQGQVTANVEALAENKTQYTGVCDLKGRLHFGLWLKKKSAESFDIVTIQDQAEALAAHIRKYGAFSKMVLAQTGNVFPSLINDLTEFSKDPTDIHVWQLEAIRTGQAYICQATEHLFQPQELRLHQRDGVHYDKGCYLGQEIVARLWFKAKPKQWLHLVSGHGDAPPPATKFGQDIEVVNSANTNDGFIALVVAKPAALEHSDLTVIALPEHLNGDVARPQS